jgi:hypothetical protein
MADVKVSALTALTGANLANGDQFLVTDVGSPNVSKSITADELAQGSQFSSRYVARSAMDRLWMSPGEFGIADGTPSLQRWYSMNGAWVLSASAVDGLIGSVYLPEHWTTFHVDAWYTHNVSGGTGDVYLECATYHRGVGDTIGGPPDGFTNIVDAVGGQYVIKEARVRTSKTNVPGDACLVNFSRRGDEATDTFTSTIAFLGLMFTKAS